ncbi:MAG: hypothetical protein ACRC7O_05235 [Fimbriiglobus sp.]
MSLPSQNRVLMVLGGGVFLFALMCSYPGGVGAAYRAATRHQEVPGPSVGPNPALAATLADRIMVKDALIHDLVNGRASLAEVSDQFQELNEGMPGSLVAIRSRHPDLPDAQLMAVNVIEYVAVVDLPDAQKEAVFDRLFDEYEILFGCPCPNIVI